ncbi:formimidoylglutamate deiminase [Flindersiella endophytica]
MTTYWCELAWLPPGAVHKGVAVTVHGAHIDAVRPGIATPPAGAVRLDGLTLPGFANVHSHAFHRALRGRVQAEGSFWTWRDQMYELAGRLRPDSYFELARATYAEMALAGITCVGEFHYLHHDVSGQPYSPDPNAMGEALIAAAREAGVRIALLDTCYLAGGIGEPTHGVQRRFDDGSADGWAARVEPLSERYLAEPGVVIGAAIHSVRAVPDGELATVAAWPNRHHAPLHVHLSEQPQENADCEAAYGLSPTRLLHKSGALGPRTTAVHATHLDDADIALLGQTGTTIGLCPTTERDLGDGIGPARALADAGCELTLGSDSHAVIDPLEETRALELDERLRSRTRGQWPAAELLRAACEAGHAALGFAGAGVITPGAWADLVSVRLDSVRTAGSDRDHAETAVLYAATAADVHHVVASGRVLTTGDGNHHTLGPVATALTTAITALALRE